MIIIEGPDGAGKSHLVSHISDMFELPVAAKVVNSDMTAMVNLREWTDQNLRRGFQHRIFDRHRLISEPIYGTVIPDHYHDGAFWDLPWLISAMSQFRFVRPLVIYCLPPLSTVKWNLAGDALNAGARPHIEAIYRAYVAQAARDTQGLVWDYTGTPGMPVIRDIFVAVERALKLEKY